MEVGWTGGASIAQDELDVERARERGDFEHTPDSEGDPDRAARVAVHRLEARCDTPLWAHASMAPRAGLVSVGPDRVEVWTASQDPWYMRGLVAAITGPGRDQVILHNLRLGGAFGERKRCQATLEAAWLSVRVGRPPGTDYPRAREERLVVNDRERFDAIMHYRPVDRCPIRDFGFWPETLLVWKQYGLPQSVPEEISTDQFFGMDRAHLCGGVVDLFPFFEEEVLEDKGETEIVRDRDGVLLERGKIMGTIPRHLDHLLKDRQSWEEHYRPRMRPDHPGRFGSEGGWKPWLEAWNDPERDHPISIYAGSLYGRQRDWFGLERISEIIYDDPGLFEEIVESWAEVAIAVVEKVCGEHGVRPDSANLWEDMCYSGGPLISPRTFEQVMVPRYRRIVDTLHKYGIDVIYVDCDGKIDKLIPLWLDAGVNCMFPVEVGTWRADPVEYRRQYGKDLLIMGGFDKRILAASRRRITEEVERLAPTVEEGGFIPFCDHLVPPDVPLGHYVHYLNEAKRVWGMGADNLRPTTEPDWEGARFKEADGYSWDVKKLGLRAEHLSRSRT